MIITGIGSRKVPREIYDFITTLPLQDHVVRSGGASGCDTAFEQTTNNLEIYLPWRNFSSHGIPLSSINPTLVKAAESIISTVHPAFNRLSHGAKLLHTRNVFQVFGVELLESNRSDVVICWTPDGAYNQETCTNKTGGTATAIRIASIFEIPVLNLYNEKHMDMVHELFNLW